METAVPNSNHFASRAIDIVQDGSGELRLDRCETIRFHPLIIAMESGAA
jgi:hypothetical protein